MDQYTDDDLGLNMLANPNKMTDTTYEHTASVNRNEPLFREDTEIEETQHELPNYFHHQREESPNKSQHLFDDTASDISSHISKISNHIPEQDILKKKNFLLTKLKRLQQKGVELTKNVSINTPLHELENEYMMAKKEQSLETNLEWCKQGLVYICSFLEKTSQMMNTGAKLNGWSEEIYNTRDNYDDVLEELIDKYGGEIEMAPEIRLIMMLVGSALAVHMSNTMMKGGINMNILNQFHEQKEKTQQSVPQQSMPRFSPTMPNMPQQSMDNRPQQMKELPQLSGPDPRLVEELLNEDISSVISDTSASSSSSTKGRRKKKNSVNITF